MTRLDELLAAGFDQSYQVDDDEYVRVRCSQCSALVISGVACHETGCPNIVRERDDARRDAEDFDMEDAYALEEEEREEDDFNASRERD